MSQGEQGICELQRFDPLLFSLSKVELGSRGIFLGPLAICP